MRGWFEKQNRSAPNLGDFLDLVALGTVADVVPLDHNNRILVAQGLRRIRAGRARPGIKALLEVAKKNPASIVASDLGFAIGPRLNAAGRLDDMTLGIQCLLTDDPYRAREIAQELDELNHDRKSIEATMQREALATLETLHLGDANALPWGVCLYNAEWHQGVIGILAARIKDRYHRPAIAFADADDGKTIKGSARSIAGLHIRDALDAVAAKHPGLLSKFGGHAMAAGLSFPRENFEAFAAAFDAEVRAQLCDDDLTAVLLSDGELTPTHMTLDVAQALRDGGPWGQHFPEPLFDGEFLVVQQRLLGETARRDEDQLQRPGSHRFHGRLVTCPTPAAIEVRRRAVLFEAETFTPFHLDLPHHQNRYIGIRAASECLTVQAVTDEAGEWCPAGFKAECPAGASAVEMVVRLIGHGVAI